MSDFEDKVADKVRRMKSSRRRGGRLWSGLALVGSVGWMIALPLVGGLMLGRWLDERLDTGLSFTLGLMLLGLFTGGWTVWRFFLRDVT